MTAPKNKELIFKDAVRYEDGCLYWVTPGKGFRIGTRAGSLNSRGYRILKYRGVFAREHRVVWMLHHGEIPAGLQIDHINRNPSDNRIENLRLATSRQNNVNRRQGDRDLPSNVTTRNGRFRVIVKAKGLKTQRGTYDTIQQAVKARAAFLEAIGAASC